MNIEEELKELKNKEEPEDDSFISLGISKTIEENKKKKKEKKKRKKSSVSEKLDKLLEDVEGISSTNDDFDLTSITDMAKAIKKSIKKKNNRMTFDTDTFMNGEGKERKKHKDILKKYLNMFKNEKALVMALLKEADNDTKVIRESFMKLVQNGSVRGVMGKVATDLAATLISANSHRLAIIKQLADLTKSANDLAFKEESRKGNSDNNELDQEILGANVLKSLFNQDIKNFNTQIRDLSAVSQDEIDRLQQNVTEDNSYKESFYDGPAIDSDGNTKEVVTPKRKKVEFDEDMRGRLDELNEKYKDDPIYGRSKAGDNLIENEARDVKINIRRWTDDVSGTVEYDFYAVDKDGIEIDDYEVPDKSTTKLSWNDETGIAKDNRGRIYKVIDI